METKVIPQDSTLPLTQENYKKYNRASMTAKEFIAVLAKDAVSAATNQGGYKLVLKETETSTLCYFRPAQWDNQEVAAEFAFVIRQNSEDIISFTPEFDEVLKALLGTETIISEGQDPYTNEYGKVVLTSKGKSPYSGVVRKIAGNSYTYDEMKTLSQNMYATAQAAVYPATLVVRGRLDIEPQNWIQVVVLTREGLIHHSSGKVS